MSPVASNVESFNDRASPPPSAPKPARTSVPKGVTPAADAQLSAVGRPPLALQTDGTENLRANYKTYEAGNTRPDSSTGRGPTLPDHFNDASV